MQQRSGGDDNAGGDDGKVDAGGACIVKADCASHVCTDQKCAPGTKDEGTGCDKHAECTSGNCSNGKCAATGCTNSCDDGQACPIFRLLR